jgi:cobaltochelatase CobS
MVKTKTKNDTLFKVSNRVRLPINTAKIAHPEFIPKNIPYVDNKKVVEQVAVSVARGMPVLLIGDTGTGKTSLVRHLAYNTKNAFVRVNHNGGTSVEDIVGRFTINENGHTEWVDGVLIEAMKNGYWFHCDEINAASPEINFVYHSLLDDDGKVVLVEKGHEVVVPHPNFRFFAAMNPPADYAGTKELNKALMSRFSVVNVDFASPKIEAEIVAARTGVDVDVAKNMVEFAGQIRASHAKGTISFVLSTRDLIMWAEMFKVYGRYTQSAETAVLNKVTDPDEHTTVSDTMGLRLKSFDDALKAGEEKVEAVEDAVDSLKDTLGTVKDDGGTCPF